MRPQAELEASIRAGNVRARNRRLVIEGVWKSGSITRSNLARMIGLAKSTIKEICDDLIHERILMEVSDESGVRRQGRPALLLKVSSERGYLLGIDIGADKIISTVAALGGERLATVAHRNDDEATKDRTLKCVRSTVREALRKSSVDSTRVLAAVAGTPGTVHPVTGSIALAPQIQGWDGINLAQELADTLELPVDDIVVERQADLSAVAEGQNGAAKDAHSALYVHLGIGIGSAILIRGELFTGFSGAAGEIGYLPHSFEEMAPPDSGFGQLEWAAGGGAFARHGREAARRKGGGLLRELAGGDPNRVDAAVVFAAARAGDASATYLVERLVERIAVGIASVVCVLNPECVILAGGLSRAGDPLLKLIDGHLHRLVPVVPQLALSAFGDEGVVTGAVYRAADFAISRICPI
jgi:glucokinase